MLSVADALDLVLRNAAPRSAVRVPIGESLGLVLAEDAASDVDSPPHDKALMDGYAVLSADLAAGPAELRVLEEVTAGTVPTREVVSGFATRIMTGAPLPNGADAVVMVERTQPVGDDRVRIDDPRVTAGQNILRRSTSLARGDVVLARGARLRPIEIGLLCETGHQEVAVIAAPRVAILVTGNELVGVAQIPAAGQIRNSNGPMLAAAVRDAGGAPIELGIARDERSELEWLVRRGLEAADVLILSGGVSAGVLDLVPGVLADLGVQQVFHKVHFKPGKPVWFGRQARPDGDRLVFGLPGNPVSSLVCFELFVRPALARLAGRAAGVRTPIVARLTTEFRQRGDRPTYFPAVVELRSTPPTVTPVRWHGSADIRGFASGTALAIFPAGDHDYAAGTEIEVLEM